ncbi:MAG: CusA/CzcA family heavy metal efflux RND transporter [Acidobacteria bacterium]|nr:CusA/CzcA family heavy metal efflux RND transporter [Acidobacteriota bacterium]
MLERIIRFSIRNRWFVLVLTLVMAAAGIHSFRDLPIDAVPDITNVQVQINTEAPGYSPLEVEQRITFPVESAMAGLPRLDCTRSISRYGLSQVTVVFEDGTSIYFARQLITERLQETKGKLPEGIEPAMGPIATGLGEIFLWNVDAEPGTRKPDGTSITSTDLRTIQDWIIRPQLRNVPGVADVNSIGGYTKEYHVTPQPEKLLAYNLSFSDILKALRANNSNVGAGYVEHQGMQLLIRAPGQVSTVDQIKKIIVDHHDGIPIHIGDVSDVHIGEEMRTGAATQNGKEVVLGTVFMLIGENSRTVSERVGEKMEEVNRSLPSGVKASVVYDRTNLVNATIRTVRNNLFEGAILVIVILFLLLRNIPAAIITSMVIPLSMLFTSTGMVANKMSGNLLSLGAIDFGLIVDGAVIMVENFVRRLSEAERRLGRQVTPHERLEIVYEASKEVRRATVFGSAIIMTVYLPILTLTGIEGKMFFPMAFTVILALLGAMILSITFVPAAVGIFLRSAHSESDNVVIRGFKKGYVPLLQYSLAHKRTVILGGIGIVVLTFGLATRMGSEFLPSLDEGDLLVHALRIPGTGLTQAVEMQHVLEERIKEFPEVERVFAKIGTADIATDPMPPSVADVYVMMKPRREWPDPDKSREEVVRHFQQELEKIPGNKYEFTQPIEMRFNELIAGVRADVAVKIVGDEMDVLVESGEIALRILESIPGVSDARLEQLTGLPMLTIEMDRNRMALHGLNIADVQEAVEIAIGGKSAGQIFEGDRRFDLIVRLPDALRQNLEAMKAIPIALPAANGEHQQFIPLSGVAKFEITQGPNQINRENGKRVAIVTANVRDRDLGSFVEEAQEKMSASLTLPAGYWMEWGGQFEHLISASRRLQIVVPIALLLIFTLLFFSFGSLKDALLVFTGVPLAMTGGILSLWVRGIPLSISAAVGFIALSGVAVLNGLVLISFIKTFRHQGLHIKEAVFEASTTRLRPVLMTALVASLGFVPMALATGSGAEVQRPLATVVIGGILSSTLLTLVVLPVLYGIFHKVKGAGGHPPDARASVSRS